MMGLAAVSNTSQHRSNTSQRRHNALRWSVSAAAAAIVSRIIDTERRIRLTSCCVVRSSNAQSNVLEKSCKRAGFRLERVFLYEQAD